MNFDWVRKKLADKTGKNLWRSMEEIAETPEFMSYLKEEFPNGSAQTASPEARRDFLKLMGASLLLAAMPGCTQPKEKIVPYVKMPEEIVPGKPLFYATGMPFNRHVTGLLAESHMGRPTKLDGNPGHTDSLGATSLFHQAAILGLYDPDRSKVVLKSGQSSSLSAFLSVIEKKLAEWDANGGEGLRILTGTVTSPTFGDQMKQVLTRFPKAKWHRYDAIHIDEARRAQKAALGEFADSVYDFKKADIVFSLGSNFLINLPGSLRYAREFTSRRQAHKDKNMNRLYAVEAEPTLTGAAADHLLRAKVSKMIAVTESLAQRVGVNNVQPTSSVKLSKDEQHWLDIAAKDLRNAQGKSLVLAGEQLPARIQALVFAINEQLGNTGKTVSWIEPTEQDPVLHGVSLAELTADIRDKKVSDLFILGINPAYAAPGDLNFSDLLASVPFSVHHGLYNDETAAVCQWHIPATHFLEHFSDGRASDGTVTMIQPLINPLYDGVSEHELVSALLGKPGRSSEKIVRGYWKDKLGLDFDGAWRKALHDGLITGSAFTAKSFTVKTVWESGELNQSFTESEWEMTLRPDESVWDGQFANNGWLQELPKPLTKLTWDNAAHISPESAQKLEVQNGDMIEINNGLKKIEVPVWIIPGQTSGNISLALGYGRTLGGQIAKGLGFNAFTIQSAALHLWVPKISVRKTGAIAKLASTQLHQNMEGRHQIRSASLDTFKKQPDFAHHLEHALPPASFYGAHKGSDDYAWGMAINLSSCIGCNACVVACNSENNIPIVGKNEVLNGREMHWVRIDHYYEGDIDTAESHQQPVMCMHCENAPCEPVCPVGATSHSDEGLNDMTYNRCIGTRYCANNCPYKVRRFNFLAYTDRDKHSEALKLMHNPDVTIRNRGVMEKCTFCVQRINQARITAKKEDRLIRDGEIKTACQTACPTTAIAFGNLKDKDSEVSKWKAQPLNYGLLNELNTQPRLTYLAKVKNPNPQLSSASESATQPAKHH